VSEEQLQYTNAAIVTAVQRSTKQIQ